MTRWELQVPRSHSLDSPISSLKTTPRLSQYINIALALRRRYTTCILWSGWLFLNQGRKSWFLLECDKNLKTLVILNAAHKSQCLELQYYQAQQN